jgi:hypothetical protein
LPAWVALAAAWLGLICLTASIVLPVLPGSRNPRMELEHFIPYSAADCFLLFPIYAAPLAMCLGIMVFWQMRPLARPLPDALVAQRLQAAVGIGLALVGTIIIYVWVALHRPPAA